tara:strand:+ start:767 stop:1336 length:570 start_codon:yes stop_codon:yes gene_type:complete
MEQEYIYISNTNEINNIFKDNTIYKYITILDFETILSELHKSFQNNEDIVNQFNIDMKRSKIVVYNKIVSYKYLKKYIKDNISPLYYYDYLISFTQAMLSIPYFILVESITKQNMYVGELNICEKNKLGDYININIINNKINIYKYLRIFYITNNGLDKTKFYIKISLKINLSNEPDNIYINFKIVKKI